MVGLWSGGVSVRKLSEHGRVYFEIDWSEVRFDWVEEEALLLLLDTLD